MWQNGKILSNAIPCTTKIQQETNGKRREKTKPLTLASLSGAFVVLGVGYFLAIAVFTVEICYSRIKKRLIDAEIIPSKLIVVVKIESRKASVDLHSAPVVVGNSEQ